MTGQAIRIRGAVQGVGFRPTVARLARARGLSGFIKNDGSGVVIGLAADPAACDAFLDELMTSLPPLASVSDVEREAADVPAGGGFIIERSDATRPRTQVVPDAASCSACRDEVMNPYENRYRYPFTNCTHCGPRYSIVTGIPYDRPQTTMAGFPLCADCRREYDDEADRRYHAQAIACHACGPKVHLERTDGRAFSVDRYSMMDEVDAVGGLITSGEIVAIKGLGGYQLCCDATNPEAVRRLRERKGRGHKAFAMMVRDLDVAARYVVLSDADRTLLSGPEGPIVLLERADGSPKRTLAAEVAPDQRRLGVMLPTTPLHQLLLRRLDRPIVCTSGNRIDEPQAIDDDDARSRLRFIADWILVHDRPIANRVDDSVVASMDGAHRVLRRARGYAPAELALPPGFDKAPAIAALGGEYKAAFALLQDGGAVVSPHLGDLDHPSAFAAYQDTFARLSEVYEHRPAAVAYDAHPGYRTHEMGRGLALGRDLRRVEVLHHHAHIAACLAENDWPLDRGPALGLALDGLGVGEDGALWGGELLACDYLGAQRLGTMKPVALLGGDKASREPWRNLYAHLRAEMSWAELDQNFGDTRPVQRLRDKPVKLLEQMLGTGTNAPPASSTGRLFDAVAAALGLFAEGIEYEGQAAMVLEQRVTDAALEEARREPYPFAIPRLGGTGLPYLEPLGMWRALLGDVWAGTDPALVSARFHVGLADGLVRLVDRARSETDLNTVALSGGCFQNRVLLELVASGLRRVGFEVLTHRRLPPNDGCLAFGQAAIAAARLLSNESE